MKMRKLTAVVDVSQYNNRQGSYWLKATRRSDDQIDLVLESTGGREYGGIIDREEAAKLLTFLADYLAHYPKGN